MTLRLWASISMDFFTGLPISQGNTTVLTVMDRFSKMTKFKELTETMINYVFRVHGFPSHIVSDRGPQFVLHL